MFCYQCEQTAKGTGCTVMGVCGKSAEVSDLQDLLIHAAKGIAMYAHRARGLGAVDGEIDRFVVEALFTTVTNVNFDNIRMAEMITQAGVVRSKTRKQQFTRFFSSRRRHTRYRGDWSSDVCSSDLFSRW